MIKLYMVIWKHHQLVYKLDSEPLDQFHLTMTCNMDESGLGFVLDRVYTLEFEDEKYETLFKVTYAEYL